MRTTVGTTLLAAALLLAIGMARQAVHRGPPPARANPPGIGSFATGTGAQGTLTRRLVTRADLAAARRYARARQGVVAFAVLESDGRPRGLLRTRHFHSASISKAMLLVAFLRNAGSRRLSESERAILRPMIVVSDNIAADTVYRQVGGSGLHTVARAAGMRKFTDAGYWASARVTAADQARLFLRIDRLVPAAHRRYARKLLASITGPQRWGIPVAARRHRLKSFFKGGWRAGITHQVALLEQRSGRGRLALAVLTSGAPSNAYGEETIEHLAVRVLRSAG